jgi:tRNA nucleotidyltransferase/poly(A) polymerase
MPDTKIQVIEEIVEKLCEFSKLYSIRSLFAVGGYCRALYMDDMESIEDIDVAAAYEEHALQLGGLFASEVLETLPNQYQNGTICVNYKSVRVEFQGKSTNSYMYNQEVVDWMRANRIEEVPLMHNVYGRDFTLNAMLFSFQSQKLYDPTGRAKNAFEDRKIESLLPAEMLVKYNPMCILRAIRFSLQYEYDIDSDLKKAMIAKSFLLWKNVSEDRIMREIVKILKINSNKRLDMLRQYGMERALLHPNLKDYLDIKEKKDEDKSD